MNPPSLAPLVTPHGHLLLAPEADAPLLAPEIQARLEQAAARGPGHLLLQLGAGEPGTALPLQWAYWRDLGARYVTALCAMPLELIARGPVLEADVQATLLTRAPPMTGTEYLTESVLQSLWQTLHVALTAELAESGKQIGRAHV